MAADVGDELELLGLEDGSPAAAETALDSKLEVRQLMEHITREVDMLERSNTLLRLELCNPESKDDPDFLSALEENKETIARKHVRLLELRHLLLQLDPAFRAEMLAAGHVLASSPEALDPGAAPTAAASVETPLAPAGAAPNSNSTTTDMYDREGLYL